MKNGGQDPFVGGDLLGEHPSAGARQGFTAAAPVPVSFALAWSTVRTRAVMAARSAVGMPVLAGWASSCGIRDRSGSGR